LQIDTLRNPHSLHNPPAIPKLGVNSRNGRHHPWYYGLCFRYGLSFWEQAWNIALSFGVASKTGVGGVDLLSF